MIPMTKESNAMSQILRGVRHCRADFFADDEHRHIRAQHKTSQSDDEQKHADEKEHERTGVHRNECNA